MQYIDELQLSGKKVFIRADLNVPLTESKEVADDTRLHASLKTINFVLEHGGKVILASHLGRPKGKFVEELSLKPIAVRLKQLISKNVIMAPDCVGEEVREIIDSSEKDEIILLENLRFHEEEEKNDISFAMKLASLADVFVNDAFATAHRAHASNNGITAFIKEKCAGFTVRDELNYFKKAFENPEKPLVVIFGGAKVSTKIGAIESVGYIADKIIIGGAMAHTFLASEGMYLGSSLYEPSEIENANAIKELLAQEKCELLMPVDLLVARKNEQGVQTKVVWVDEIEEGWLALDIGPVTIDNFINALDGAKTIVWNGPMGAFENETFSAGTYKIAEALAASSALSIVGGGDTNLALHRCNVFDKMDYVSTGGGAFLALLEGEELPGIEALEPIIAEDD
jgi:phosphoglycerate kinase